MPESVVDRASRGRGAGLGGGRCLDDGVCPAFRGVRSPGHGARQPERRPGADEGAATGGRDWRRSRQAAARELRAGQRDHGDLPGPCPRHHGRGVQHVSDLAGTVCRVRPEGAVPGFRAVQREPRGLRPVLAGQRRGGQLERPAPAAEVLHPGADGSRARDGPAGSGPGVLHHDRRCAIWQRGFRRC